MFYKAYPSASQIDAWDPHPDITRKYCVIFDDNFEFKERSLHDTCKDMDREIAEFYNSTRKWKIPYQYKIPYTRMFAGYQRTFCKYIRWSPFKSTIGLYKDFGCVINYATINFNLEGVTNGKSFMLKWMDSICELGEKEHVTPEAMSMVMIVSNEIAVYHYGLSLKMLLHYKGKDLTKIRYI